MRKKSRNSLYALLEHYLRNQPDVKPAQAWAHFANLARLGGTPGLVVFHNETKQLEFAPDTQRLHTKRVSYPSFARRLQFIRQDIYR